MAAPSYSTTARHSVAVALLAVLPIGASGCESREPSPGARLAPVTAAPIGSAVLARKAADELVLDLASDGSALVARVEPALPDSDGDRIVVARVLGADGRDHPVLGGQRVVEARFVGGGWPLLVIDTQHALVRVAAPGAAPETLGQSVYGPLSLSDDGRVAAYTRGDPPFLEVVHHTLATGQTVAVAPGVAPAWCPALSPDGREIVFVATTEGRPRWWRGVVGERVGVWEAVGADAPFATGPSAPRVYGDALVFENEAGVHSLGLDGTLRRTLPGLHNPVMPPRGAQVLATRSATDLRLTRIDVALRTGSPR
jgi:hypothetical protein